MESYQDEREIDLKQLFCTVMAKWRVLLVCALIGAILGGAYQALRGGQPSETTTVKSSTGESGEDAEDEEEEEYPVAYAKYLKDKAYYDGLNAFYNARVDEDILLMNEREAYDKASIRTAIDPYATYHAYADVFIVTDGGNSKNAPVWNIEGDVMLDISDASYHILATYNQLISQELDLTKLAKQFETEPKYLAELLSFGRDLYSCSEAVTVIAPTEEMADALMDEVLKTAEGLLPQVTKIAGSHRLEIVRSETRLQVSQGLYTEQINDANNLQTIRNRVTANQDALAKLEEPEEPAGITVEEQSDDEDEEASKTVITVEGGVSVKAIIKFIVLGCFGGFFSAAFLFAMYYVLSGRVLSADELNRRYRIKALSVLPGEARKGIDAKIASFGNDRVYLNMSKEESAQIAASNFSVYAPDVQDVILVGSVAAEKLEAVAKLLGERIENVRFACASHINENAASMEALKSHEHVILVEQALSSVYGEVDREVKQLADWGKRVIGSVVIY